MQWPPAIGNWDGARRRRDTISWTRPGPTPEDLCMWRLPARSWGSLAGADLTAAIWISHSTLRRSTEHSIGSMKKFHETSSWLKEKSRPESPPVPHNLPRGWKAALDRRPEVHFSSWAVESFCLLLANVVLILV